MPELPEVETIVRDLNKKVLRRTFIDVWTDNPKTIKKPKNQSTKISKKFSARPSTQLVECSGFKEFRNKIKGKKILKIRRRAKNIIFELSDNYSLLVHQKLTGHLLIGCWVLDDRYWKAKKVGPLEDLVNRYIHLMFWLSGDLMLALSDLRKFAKVELWKTEELLNSKELKNLGPEPLEKTFTFEKFKNILSGKKAARQGEPCSPRLTRVEAGQRRGKIKQVLMNQEIIAGIGNIYSDEILWHSKIHPFKDVSKLTNFELKSIYQNIKKVLKLAIKLRGESISDYRDLQGRKGFFDTERKVYRREGEKCSRCGKIIQRIKIGGRSAHFCPKCQLKG